VSAWPASTEALWRRAHEPVAAHDLAVLLLTPGRYERTRGVAQQAARAARASRLGREERRRLLAVAWLHDTTAGDGAGWIGPLLVARRLRGAGHEPMARVVAHAANTPMAAALADHPPVVREFPAPSAGDLGLVALLDVALLTTRADGTPGTPADALGERIARIGSPGVAARALVALVAHLADDPPLRALVEVLARRD
jgi:hypothetical protein